MSGLRIAIGDTLVIQDEVILPIGQNLEYAMSVARGRDRSRIRSALSSFAAVQESAARFPGGAGDRAVIDAFLHDVFIRSRHLEDACDTALSCALRLDQVNSPAIIPGRAGTPKIALSAARLLHLATRLLPAADRARYAQEYACELHDLAQTGAGRFRQVQYAVRQAGRMPRIGVTLRSPRRRSAIS